MKRVPATTYELCKGIARTDKFKIRKEANTIPKRFKDGEEVEIADFVDIDKGRVPYCRNRGARLLVFKGHEGPQWHPMWILDCSKCSSYDPKLEHRRTVHRRIGPMTLL